MSINIQMLMIYNLDGRFTLDSQNNIMKKVIDIWTEKIRASDEYDDFALKYLASIIERKIEDEQ